MKLFKITAKINDLLTEELIEATYPQAAIDIFKNKHITDRIEHLDCQIYTIWGWV